MIHYRAIYAIRKMPAYLMKEAFQEELYLLWSNDRYVLNVNNCIPFR